MRFSSRITVLLIMMSFALPQVLRAQDDDEDGEDTTTEVQVKTAPPRKFYVSNGLDMAILSTSTLERPVTSDLLTPLRFSYIINFGFNLNYDLSKNFGVFTGIGIKNIGFIEKFRVLDSTVKRRVYTLGVPVGIKVGNLRRRNFVLAGGGADLALNYREKGFIRRGNKDKFNEWFSDRTPLIMPYVFLGGSFDPGVTLKLQYYPGNFLNTGFTEKLGTVTVAPYAGYEVHLFLLSIGFDIHYKKKPKEIEDVRRTM